MIGYSPLNDHHCFLHFICPPCRCLINGCDSASETEVEYWPYWLNRTVPFDYDDHRLAKCLQYVRHNPDAINKTNKHIFQCDNSDFNKSLSVQCDEFVFESDGETTIVSAVSNNT